MNRADLIIHNGRVVDPARDIDEIGAVAVRGGRILPWEPGMAAECEVDAAGCLVLPGLIDFHAHIYERGSDSGINPDLSMLPNGVTAVVDAGSSGVSTYRAFLDRLAGHRIVSRIYLHLSPSGQVTHQYPEPILPDSWSMDKFAAAFEEGGDRILGLKLRISRSIIGEDKGLAPLHRALEVAERFGKSLVVHVTDPPATQTEVADALRPGDIFCHVYNGTGNGIFADDGQTILPALRRARERGVLFDCCHGAANFSFGTAERALAQGFAPDIISTDMTTRTWCRSPVYGLPHVMSKLLCCGMPLAEVVRATTAAPAARMGMGESIGSLRPGGRGNITVLKPVEGETLFTDSLGDTRTGTQALVPVMTVLDGTIVHITHDLWQRG